MKLARWHKGIVEWREGDTVYLSVVFTWDADDAYQRAVFYAQMGLTVRVGGPGVFVNRRAFEGVATVGGDMPDAVRRHNAMATFASRGCPVGCWFCIVPAMEGRTFTLVPEFTPRPILCDNNLSALPVEYQDYIVERYKAAGAFVWDANSGFEPATFDEEVRRRWEAVNRGPWRFAFDESKEGPDVERVMRILRDVDPKRTRVYVLIGNEPVEDCLERIRKVLAWGGEPHVQPLMKLNARVKRPWVRYDWTARRLADAARWANWRLWKYTTFEAYDSSIRTSRQRRPEPDDLFAGETS